MDKALFFNQKENVIKQSIIDAIYDYVFTMGETSEDRTSTILSLTDIGVGSGRDSFPVSVITAQIDLRTGKKTIIINGVRDGQTYNVDMLLGLFRGLQCT